LVKDNPEGNLLNGFFIIICQVNRGHIPMHGTGHMKRGIWKQYLSHRSDFFEKYDGYIISTEGPEADPEELKDLAKKLKKVSRNRVINRKSK